VTAEEIKVIESKIGVAQQCRERMKNISPVPEQYFRGMLDAYSEILQKLGGVINGEETGKW
jgi:hypothetical protein